MFFLFVLFILFFPFHVSVGQSHLICIGSYILCYVMLCIIHIFPGYCDTFWLIYFGEKRKVKYNCDHRLQPSGLQIKGWPLHAVAGWTGKWLPDGKKSGVKKKRGSYYTLQIPVIKDLDYELIKHVELDRLYKENCFPKNTPFTDSQMWVTI